MSKYAVKSDFCEWGCRTGGNSPHLSRGAWSTFRFKETRGYGATPSTKAGQMPIKRNDPHAPSPHHVHWWQRVVHAFTRHGRHYAYALKLQFCGVVHIALPTTSWIADRRAHVGCLRTSGHEAQRAELSCTWHVNAEQGKQFMQCTVTENETWVNHPPPGITQHFPQQRNSKLCHQLERPWQLSFGVGGTIKVCCLCISLPVVTR